MDSAKSGKLEDSLADAERRYKELCLKIYNADCTNAAPKPSLFPNKKTKAGVRESIVRRACLKKSVISSTPMPCAKKKEFASGSISSMSPISNEVLQTKSTNSRKKLNNDNFMCISSSSLQKDKKSIHLDQPSSNHQSTSSIKKSQKKDKEEYLNKIITKIALNRKQKTEQLQTLTANSQHKLDNTGRKYVRSLARNLFSNSTVDYEIQTRSSLTKDDSEYNSDEEEQILANCENGKLISKKFYKMILGDSFTEKKIDLKGPWRAPSGLQLYNTCDQDSVLALNSSTDENTLDDTFLPKLPRQKKVFVNKKSRGRPKKDKNNGKKSITSSPSSVERSHKNIKRSDQSKRKELIDCNNTTEKTAKTIVSRMTQTTHQIEDTYKEQENFNGSKRPVREKHVNSNREMEVVNNNQGTDRLNEKEKKRKTSRTVQTECCGFEDPPIKFNGEMVRDKMLNSPKEKLVDLNDNTNLVIYNRSVEADLMDIMPTTEEEAYESIPINGTEHNTSSNKELVTCSSKYGDPITIENSQNNKSTEGAPVKNRLIRKKAPSIDSSPDANEINTESSLRQTRSMRRDLNISSKRVLNVQLTKIDTNKNQKKNRTRIEQSIENINTDNALTKPKPGRPKKNLSDLRGNSNIEPSSSGELLQTQTVIKPKKKSVKAADPPDGTKQQELRRSGRERRPVIKVTSHTLLYESQKALSRMEKNIPKQSFVNILTDHVSVKTLFCNSKILSPIEEIQNENVDDENVHSNKRNNKILSGKISKKHNGKKKQKLIKAVNKTLDQPATFDSILNIEDNSHIPKKWHFNCPKFKKVAKMAGISTFTMDGIATGLLQIGPRNVKPKQFAPNHDLTFVVVEGHATVGVQEERRTFNKLGVFLVRQGTNYSIENTSDTEDLVLVYSRFKR